MNTLEIKPAASPLYGRIEIPPDKSISHRAAILGSLCKGKVLVKNFSTGADCNSSVQVIKKLGTTIEKIDNSTLLIHGNGLHGYSEPDDILDAGNSGTTIRLMLGILAAQKFYSVITGDQSLKKRPMARVINPLKEMGANIIGRKDNKLAPISVYPGNLFGINYNMPIASAQVKSSILLAGLHASGTTTINEPAKSRDHTERMLQYLGAKLTINNLSISIDGMQELEPKEIIIPGDISSAAFFMIAASIVEGSSITITNVGMNTTRTGILSVLSKMGANIQIVNQRDTCGEPIADLVVNASKLKGIEIGGDIIPTLIDEVPIIAVAASFAEGITVIKDAEDLRNKESDRLNSISIELKKLGAEIEETSDGLIIHGNKSLQGGCQCECYHDHRIAMSLAIAGLATNKPVSINDAGWIDISFPEFKSTLEKLREKEYGKQIF